MICDKGRGGSKETLRLQLINFISIFFLTCQQQIIYEGGPAFVMLYLLGGSQKMLRTWRRWGGGPKRLNFAWRILWMAPNVFHVSIFSFIVPFMSSVIIFRFLQMYQVGISHYIKRKYLYQEKEEKTLINFNPIELSMVAVPLIFLICGYLIAIIFILIEIILRRTHLHDIWSKIKPFKMFTINTHII